MISYLLREITPALYNARKIVTYNYTMKSHARCLPSSQNHIVLNLLNYSCKCDEDRQKSSFDRPIDLVKRDSIAGFTNSSKIHNEVAFYRLSKKSCK